MVNAAQVESYLRAHSLPAIEAFLPPDEFIMPHYQGLGIANLPATVAALLGSQISGLCPPLQHDLWQDWREGIKRVVLVIVDALGYLQLREAMAEDDGLVFHRLAQAGRMVPITTTFPSTTNNVLSTLWTGHSPAAHGILAYELYLRELGVAASALFFWPVYQRRRDALVEWGLDPETFIPVPGLAQQLIAQGITTHSFISKTYADSALSQIHRRGIQQVHRFVSGGDMWVGLQRTIEQQVNEKLFLVAYWDRIDGITHQCGTDDDPWTLELRAFSWMMETGFLSRLTPAQRDGTLLLLAADHGGVTTPSREAIKLDDHPVLRDALSLPPMGESRVPFLHTRGDTLEQVRMYVQERLGQAFVTLTREQVLASGLLGTGPMYAETPHRLGDLIGLARGNHYLARTKRQLQMQGRHGGLSAREMLVPLLGVRLDAL
jgi:hypothetical protein